MSDDGFDAIGFPLPIPKEIADLLRKGHDQAHMSAEANAARVDRFIAGLDVDGCMAFRSILNMGDMRQSMSANFWDGQIYSILKYIHRVDPETGQPDPLSNLTAPPTDTAD
jgi:hypothetical protein